MTDPDPGESAGSPPQWPASPASVRLHGFFLAFNRWAVPVLRSPVGALFMNPLAGYAMLLRTRGRRSGAWRFAPLNYAIVDGAVYCLAGFGRRTHWFRNVCAEPRVAVRLPLRWVDGFAAEVVDPAERLRAVRAVLHAAGWAGFLVGANPWSVPDDVLLARTAGLPVVRVRRVDGQPIVPGPADPGGWLWVPVVGAQLCLARWLRRRATGRWGDAATRRRGGRAVGPPPPRVVKSALPELPRPRIRPGSGPRRCS